MLEDSVRSSANTAPHLSEWIELIRADTRGKKSIEKYARWFVIQHNYRVLYSRHADALHRSSRAIEAEMSRSLNIARDTLHLDLINIRKKLKPNWFMS